MDDLTAFLRQLEAEPADATGRKVFADYLQERGWPERLAGLVRDTLDGAEVARLFRDRPALAVVERATPYCLTTRLVALARRRVVSTRPGGGFVRLDPRSGRNLVAHVRDAAVPPLPRPVLVVEIEHRQYEWVGFTFHCRPLGDFGPEPVPVAVRRETGGCLFDTAVNVRGGMSWTPGPDAGVFVNPGDRLEIVAGSAADVTISLSVNLRRTPAVRPARGRSLYDVV